jgi:autotransporter-associated beta strand protein
MRDGSNAALAHVFINNSTSVPDYSADLTAVNAWLVVGGAADDQLTVDYSNGSPLPAGGLNFDGGDHSAGDRLIIKGGHSADTITMTAVHGVTQFLVTGGGGAGSKAPFGGITCSAVEQFAFDLGTGADQLVLSSGAVLRASGPNTISDGTAVTVDGGTLDLAGNAETIASLTVVSGSVVNGTLVASSYAIQAGTVAATLTGPGALTKTTDSTVLLGGVNTYTGGTAIAGGLIQAATAAALGTGPVTMTGGGALTIAIEVREGVQTTSRVAAFSDPWGGTAPAAPEDFHALIDWGDGSASDGMVRVLDAEPRSYEVLGSHAYAQSSTYVAADPSLGDNRLSVDSFSASFSANRWTLSFTVSNTSLTDTLRDVHLVQPFVWDASTTPKVAMAWDNNAHQWKLGNKTFTTHGVSGQNELMCMDRAMVDTPLSWLLADGNEAVVSPADSVPATGIGDFSPLQSKSFTVVCSVSQFFMLDLSWFFVAAREPVQHGTTVTISKPSLPGASRVLTSTATVVTPVARAWDGRKDDGTPSAGANWQTPENWSSDSLPQAGNLLLFPTGAARLANTVDYQPGTGFHSLVLSGGGYTIGGAGLGLSAGIINRATATTENVLDIGIRLDAPQTFQNQSGAALVISGAIDTNGNRLTIDGPGPVRLTGAIGGQGALTKTGTGTTEVSGVKVYGGGTTVTAGTLLVAGVQGLPAGGGLTIGPGATVALAVGLIGSSAVKAASNPAAAPVLAATAPAAAPAARPEPVAAAAPDATPTVPALAVSALGSTSVATTEFAGTAAQTPPNVQLLGAHKPAPARLPSALARKAHDAAVKSAAQRSAGDLSWMWALEESWGRKQASRKNASAVSAVDAVLAGFAE